MLPKAKQPDNPDHPGYKLRCPLCGAEAVLVDSRVIYRYQSFGFAWVCKNFPLCDTYCGCHPGTNQPLGSLATAAMRNARRAAHDAFDALWRKKMARDRVGKSAARALAYAWLARKLGIGVAECHISMFDKERCAEVIRHCTPPFRKDC